MLASELDAGRFFEFVDDVHDEYGRCMFIGNDNYGYNFAFRDAIGRITYDWKVGDFEVTLPNVHGWDDEPQVNINACDNPDGPCACGAWHKIEPAPLQLREGAWYRRRDGKVVGEPFYSQDGFRVSWWMKAQGEAAKSYEHDGREVDGDGRFNIIAEVPPPPVESRLPPPFTSEELTASYAAIPAADLPPVEPPRRIDSEGRDVTDLPGLWDESDAVEPTEPFKVGDLVVSDTHYTMLLKRGKVYEVTRADVESIVLDNGQSYFVANFRRATPAEVAAYKAGEVNNGCDDLTVDRSQPTTQPDADADGWIAWSDGHAGGPVDGETLVSVKYRSGRSRHCILSRHLYWDIQNKHDDIVAYRLVPQPASWVIVCGEGVANG